MHGLLPIIRRTRTPLAPPETPGAVDSAPRPAPGAVSASLPDPARGAGPQAANRAPAPKAAARRQAGGGS